MDPTQNGGGVDWQSFANNMGNLFNTGANLYGSYLGMQNQNNLSGAVNSGFKMAGGAYNPTMFGMNGVGGTGFSVSSPTNGQPGSINASLGSFNPMYGAYAGAAGQYNAGSLNLANTAAGGATGAYQSALASMMPQLQQMQNNLLAANNNSLFQRGQLGSGSYGQMGAGGNPVNLTTQSLGAGFAQQDLNAIMAAQNQGLNFFNSNLQGAQALGGLGFGATNTGLGMINAQNAMAQTPLAYSGLYGNQEIGASNAMANVIKAGNVNGNAFGSGTAGMLQNFGGAPGMQGGGGGNPLGQIGQIIGAGKSLYGAYNALTGGGGGGLNWNGPGSTYSGFTPGGYASGMDPNNPWANGGDTTGSLYVPGAGEGGNADYISGDGFNGAGGQAAAAGAPGQAGIQSGSGMAGFGKGLGAGFDALGVYQGLKQGGFMGDASAAVNAGKLANMAGANIPYLGPAGAALSTYSAIKNWQSGATGQDALQGAEAGAAWGSLAGPVGTVVGALVGGAAGALSSAFGGGKSSPESMMTHGLDSALAHATDAQRSATIDQMPANESFQMINGYMNAHNNSPGHSEPIEQVFGKNGVGNMMGQMMPAINAAIKKDPALAHDSPSQLYSQVVAPWLKSKGASIDPNARDSKGNPEGKNLIDAVTSFIGDWQSGSFTGSTPLGIGGQSLGSSFETFGGGPSAPTAQAAAPPSSMFTARRGRDMFAGAMR